jgi:aspartyl/asparaginyl beta-hydroxylase (cupin superfamily)
MFMQASRFPFLAPLQRDWQRIRDELLALNAGYFVQWPQYNIYTGRWTTFGLYKFGNKIESHCALCPHTTQLIEAVPGMVNAGFSSLAPNTHITPHTGVTNRVLRYHLGLVTTENCAIRVGAETRSWTPGSCFVFDDTTRHEAWNRSKNTRVILLLDFKRDADEQVVFPDGLWEGTN